MSKKGHHLFLKALTKNFDQKIGKKIQIKKLGIFAKIVMQKKCNFQIIFFPPPFENSSQTPV